ncbi:MAG: hypothetical protein QNI86_03920 [Halieaceae bacterium]|nr:hypothetical protein [Halieaceae bacterium]
MEINNRIKFHTMIMRELQEYRGSLLITPVAFGGALIVIMLVAVIFAGRLAVIGEGALGILMGDEGRSINFEVTIDEDSSGGQELYIDRVKPDTSTLPSQELTVVVTPLEVPEDTWNFSQEWSFSAPSPEPRGEGDDIEGDSLNPVLGGFHNVFCLIMFLVTINYLLGCLYTDRKDRSILFWKSMPVSEWQEVLAKLAVASVVVPIIYLGVSLITQILETYIAMVLVWRMDGSGTELVLSRVQFIPLIIDQMGGMVVWVLFTLPAYAWFMLASATAKRSPFLLAIAIPIGLVLGERLLFGTQYVLASIANHLPHKIDGDDVNSLGLYDFGPVWSQLDYLGMVFGFVFAGAFLAGAVWLRKHRFET